MIPHPPSGRPKEPPWGRNGSFPLTGAEGSLLPRIIGPFSQNWRRMTSRCPRAGGPPSCYKAALFAQSKVKHSADADKGD
jgi:hypothetical protein